MLRVAVLTTSKQAEHEEANKQFIEELVEEGFEVVSSKVLPREKEVLKEQLVKWCDHNKADLVLTLGGIGFAIQECVPEATASIIQRQVPGIPEAMRYAMYQALPHTMLGRGIAGIRKQTLIINLPENPVTARNNLMAVIGIVEQGVEMLQAQ